MIVLDGTSGITSPNETVTGQFSSGSTFGFKNRIINGNMAIDQRNAGAAVTLPSTGSQYTLDRWTCASYYASKYSVQQNAGSVTPPVGFTNYLGVTSLAATTVAAGEYYFLTQSIEGYNIADLNFGTVNAKTVTLSFWVRSSLTGTFGGALQAQGSTRTYPFGYSISVANTWTQISVTVPGETTGTWFTTNGVGLQVFFGLGIGTTYSGTTGSWSTNNYISVTGAVSVVGTSGATFYITGVQLEKGSVATSFDQRAYSQELSLCQRYYRFDVVFGAQRSTSIADCYCIVSMRATPTITPAALNIEGIGSPASQSYVSTGTSGSFVRIETSFTANGTLGTPCTQSFAASAEL